MFAADEMPAPGLAEAFTVALAFGPAVVVGRLATGGRRSVRPVNAGTIRGDRLSGRVISGAETSLARADGVTVVEAQYLIEDDAGRPARVLGTGYALEGEDFQGLRMTLAFEAEETSEIAWLATRVFVAERAVGDRVLTVREVL